MVHPWFKGQSSWWEIHWCSAQHKDNPLQLECAASGILVHQQHGWDIPTEYQLRHCTPEQLTRKSAKRKGKTNKIATPKYEHNNMPITYRQTSNDTGVKTHRHGQGCYWSSVSTLTVHKQNIKDLKQTFPQYI